jgi:hypothetical protein
VNGERYLHIVTYRYLPFLIPTHAVTDVTAVTDLQAGELEDGRPPEQQLLLLAVEPRLVIVM